MEDPIAAHARLSWVPLVLLLAGCPPEEKEAVPVLTCDAVSSVTPFAWGMFGAEGPKAQARPGDPVLVNDRIRVVIQGPGRSIAANPWGGAILDADVVRDDDSFLDHFGELGLLMNLAGTSTADEVTSIAPDPAAGRCYAEVVATGTYALSDYFNPSTGMETVYPAGADIDFDVIQPLDMTLRYRLEPGESVVRITLELTNTGTEPVPALIAWLMDGGIVNAAIPAAGAFSIPQISITPWLVQEGGPVSYGLVPLGDTEGEGHALISVVGASGLAHEGNLSGLLGYPDSAPQVEPGETRSWEAVFAVAVDHASVAQLLRAELGESCVEVTGQVVEDGSADPLPGVEVTVSAFDGGQLGIDLANTTTDADGRFSACVPDGELAVIAGVEGRPYGSQLAEPEAVAVTPGESITVTLPGTGHVSATLTDADGEPLPGRLTIVGLDPSPPSARLAGDGADALAPGIAAIVDSADGGFETDLEPGSYDLWLSRGPEYDAWSTTIELVAGGDEQLAATLHRVVDTPGYLSGDFHVHSQSSTDSTVTNLQRVQNMVAEGVEILISTDHATVVDYGPDVTELGVGEWLATGTGQEVSTFDYGHYNAFPLPHDPELHNGGAIDWPGKTQREIRDEIVAKEPTAVFQLNHPRSIPTPAAVGNYFEQVDLVFDAEGAYSGPNSRDPEEVRLDPTDELFQLTFTAMEVMTWLNVQGLSDWFNLINAGVFITATGNSDTHTTRVESSGWPRNFVRVGTDAPAELAIEDLVAALHGGRSVVSFGAFPDLVVMGSTVGEVGDTVRPDAAGEVAVAVTVQSPTWAAFDRVEIIDGSTGALLGGGAVVPIVEPGATGSERLSATVEATYTVAEDHWVVALVTGSSSLFPVVPYNHADRSTVTLEELRSGVLPDSATVFAVTNPIWIDADGDGQITPTHHVMLQDAQDWPAYYRTAPYGD